MKATGPNRVGRPAATLRPWSRLSLGLVAAVVGGVLTTGLHPSGAAERSAGVEPGEIVHPGDAPAVPAPDTLVLTGAIPTTRSPRTAGTPGGACPAAALDQIRHVFRWHMDFPRDLRPGDTFRAILLRPRSRSGVAGSDGYPSDGIRVLGAEIGTRGRTTRAVWYRSPGGSQRGYFEPDGTPVGAGRIPTPDGFRLTSRFNWGRFHPIYRERRPHLGVDYAVPRGEVVRAVASGTVSRVGRIAGLGLVVQIKHDAHRSTRYAHLSSVETGIVVGRSVAAGEALGSAGSTGIATGPHLHFELLLDGQQRDPLAQTRRQGASHMAPASDLPSFSAQRDRVVELLATSTPPDPTSDAVLVSRGRRPAPAYTGAGMMLAWVRRSGPLPASHRRGVARWPLPAGEEIEPAAPAGTTEARSRGDRIPAAGDASQRDEGAVQPHCALGKAADLADPALPYVITSVAGTGARDAGVPVWGDLQTRSGG